MDVRDYIRVRVCVCSVPFSPNRFHFSWQLTILISSHDRKRLTSDAKSLLTRCHRKPEEGRVEELLKNNV